MAAKRKASQSGTTTKKRTIPLSAAGRKSNRMTTANEEISVPLQDLPAANNAAHLEIAELRGKYIF
jgi:hypothetical protein